MSFNPGSGTIGGASDVALSNPVTSNFLAYNTSLGKWQNTPLNGYATLANQGGMEGYWSNFNATGAITLDLANGNIFRLTLKGDVTFSFTGSTNNLGCSFTLYIKQDGTGSRAVTWPTSVAWAGGVAPTLSTGANAMDIVVFETITGGTTWFGALVGTNFL